MLQWYLYQSLIDAWLIRQALIVILGLDVTMKEQEIIIVAHFKSIKFIGIELDRLENIREILSVSFFV